MAGSGLPWTSRYAVAGLNALGLDMVVDGMNEKGLAGGLLEGEDRRRRVDGDRGRRRAGRVADVVGRRQRVLVAALDQRRRVLARGLAEGRGKESVQEDARFVLPNAAETKIVVTMNARELRHFFTVRCCRRAARSRPGSAMCVLCGCGRAQ